MIKVKAVSGVADFLSLNPGALLSFHCAFSALVNLPDDLLL
jgi:hypothetical protein